MLFCHVVIAVCACTFVTCTLIKINQSMIAAGGPTIHQNRLFQACFPTFSQHHLPGTRCHKQLWSSTVCQFLGRLPKVDLIILEGRKMSVRTSVRPSTKSFFDFNEIRYTGRGRWVMHDGMPYGRIQGQGQGHEPFKVWISSIFKTYLLRHLQWQLASDH